MRIVFYVKFENLNNSIGKSFIFLKENAKLSPELANYLTCPEFVSQADNSTTTPIYPDIFTLQGWFVFIMAEHDSPFGKPIITRKPHGRCSAVDANNCNFYFARVKETSFSVCEALNAVLPGCWLTLYGSVVG